VGTLRAAPYARISREDVGNIDNTDIQIEECTDYINSEGWQLVGTFVDDNVSAYSDRARRPNYERLLVAIRANQLDVIVVTELSRLNRRLWDSIGLFRLAESTDFQWIKTSDGRGGFDLSTPEGRDTAISAAIEAERESRRLGERQSRKKRRQATNGMYSGGPRAYGYEGAKREACTRPDCDGKKNCKHGRILNKGRVGMEVVESEAAIIREVARRLIDGESSRSITADLQRRSIKTATGQDWQPTNLSHLFESPRICGYRTHHGVLYPAQWPAIISRDDWDKIQLLRKARANAETPITARRYLLTGIAVCGGCGTPLLGQNWHRDDTVTRKYRCPKDELYKRRGGCGSVYRQAEPLDLLVTEAVLRALGSPRLLAALSTQANDDELRALIDEERADEARLEELKVAWANRVKGLSLQDMLSMKAMIEENMEARRRKMATMQSGRALARIPLGADIREVWEKADIDFRRDLIRLVVEKVVVKPGRTYQKWRGQYRFDPSLVEIHWKV
jgi:DNA invertase Pin-like site-specific DNA recombinase